MRNVRRARVIAFLILLSSGGGAAILNHYFLSGWPGFWVLISGLILFVTLFVGLRDIFEGIKRIYVPAGRVVLGLIVVGVAFSVFVPLAPSVFSESPWAYALKYDTDSTHVHITPKPGDCDFLSAPIGFKDCHYEKSVEVTRHANGSTGPPIVSYDDGKTWHPLPADQLLSSSVEVYVSWNRVKGER
jgi:hypothetical protein